MEPTAPLHGAARAAHPAPPSHRPRSTAGPCGGFDVTPVRAGGFRHLPGLYRRSDSRSLRVNPLPRPRVDCTTPQDRQTGHAQERRATRRPAQAGVAPVSRAPVAGHPRAAGVGGCGGRYRRLPGQRSWRFNPVGSCRGRYHTDRQPGAALQNTAMCPAGPPPARSRTACAAGQSHSTHDTVIRPGPHSCAFEHRSG